MTTFKHNISVIYSILQKKSSCTKTGPTFSENCTYICMDTNIYTFIYKSINIPHFLSISLHISPFFLHIFIYICTSQKATYLVCIFQNFGCSFIYFHYNCGGMNNSQFLCLNLWLGGLCIYADTDADDES